MIIKYSLGKTGLKFLHQCGTEKVKYSNSSNLTSNGVLVIGSSLPSAISLAILCSSHVR